MDYFSSNDQYCSKPKFYQTYNSDLYDVPD